MTISTLSHQPPMFYSEDQGCRNDENYIAGDVGLQVGAPPSVEEGDRHLVLVAQPRTAHPLARPAQSGVPLQRSPPTSAAGLREARLLAAVPRLGYQLPNVRPVQEARGVRGVAAAAREAAHRQAGGGRVKAGCLGAV